MMNPNDAVRDAILRYLYEKHSKARGPGAVGAKFREIQSEMKKLGYKQAQTISNLDYLVQKGWVQVDLAKKYYTVGGTARPSETRRYKISDVGIDTYEGGSVYYRVQDRNEINLVNVKGVTVIGDGNIVNTELTDLSRALDDLENSIADSPGLEDDKKLELISDVKSLQSQIASPRPKKELINRIWQGIEKVVTAAGFAGLVSKISGMIAGLI